jgi:anti-sigma B factor antagonist
MSVPSPDPTRGSRSTLSIVSELIDDETAVLMLSGEADLWSAPELKRTLYDMLAQERRLVIDLAGVRFMDSTALGVLVAIERRLAGDERLALADPSPEVLRLFELTGLTAGFRIFPTRSAAVRHVTVGHAEPAVGAALPPLTADAALLLGIAATAMPFAQSLEEQAERWLTALRRHGEAGAVLASLGVQESSVGRHEDVLGPELARLAETDAVEIVTDQAGHVAADRGAAKLTTSDVLRAVIQVYGETFDRVLAAHAVRVDELLERLERAEPAGAERPA